MYCGCLLSYGLFAITAYAETSSSSSSSGSRSSSSSSTDGITILGGITEPATPTGSYLSYSSTITLTSSPLTTEAILSTVTSGSTTRTTTLGSTTILGIGSLISSNATATSTHSTTTDSQVLLSGSVVTSSSTSSLNSTSNSTATSSSAPQPTNTTPCNNYPEFCSRRYGNITEVAAHNSPFVKTDNAAANQALDVTTQLNDGIRMLQGQMHFVNSTPHFCHTSCDVLDAGPITDYLGKVNSWVASHPYDVVTILLENGDYNPVTQYVPFIEQTGLVQYAYLPPKIPMAITDWPTLGAMILTGKRVIFFMDYQANQTAVPWILDEFSQMWETPFDPTDRSFPCTIQRPPALLPEDAPQRLYLDNHNLNYDISLLGNSLLVPNIPLLNITNNVTGYGSLGLNAQQCNDTWNYPPKFLNVDYYNVGNGSVFKVAATFNNVTYNRQCCGLPVSAAPGMNEIVGRSAILLAICVVGVSILLL